MSRSELAEIHSYLGHRPNPCPGVLGHEIIGNIVALGSDIKRDMRGDTLEVKLFDARGDELARESLYEDDGEDEHEREDG